MLGQSDPSHLKEKQAVIPQQSGYCRSPPGNLGRRESFKRSRRVRWNNAVASAIVIIIITIMIEEEETVSGRRRCGRPGRRFLAVGHWVDRRAGGLSFCATLLSACPATPQYGSGVCPPMSGRYLNEFHSTSTQRPKCAGDAAFLNTSPFSRRPMTNDGNSTLVSNAYN